MTVALFAPNANALSPCPPPQAFAFPYAPGDENTISWNASVAGGFRIQVAADPAFSQIVATAEPGANQSERTFSDLAEAQHWYRVKAKAASGMCSDSAWSAPVSTIQDATAPVVSITTSPQPIGPVPVRPPVPVFLMNSEVRLEGMAVDRPGGSAPSGAGPHSVTWALVNTTPVVGAGAVVTGTALVDTDGSWLVRLQGAQKPPTGTYSFEARGIDKVGNIADEPERLAIVVIL